MLSDAKDVHAGYGQGDVLRGVSVGIDEGTIVALLGPNGAGKSTLLKTLAGVIAPSSGSVRLGGVEVGGARAADLSRCGVYLVPEGRALFPSLTVAENLRMASGRPERLWGDVMGRTLELFPRLGQRLTQRAGTLSGGEQQMLALARAFIAQPVLLLLDEPSLGLAPKVIDEVFDVIGHFRAGGTAVILVEQYVGRALAIADRATLLLRGSIVFEGESAGLTPDDIAGHYLGGARTK